MKMKDWLNIEHQCIVCGQMFMPLEATCDIDVGAPTCSDKCKDIYKSTMESMADERSNEQLEDAEKQWERVIGEGSTEAS